MLPAGERSRETCWDGVRDVVVARYGHNGRPEAPQEVGGTPELRALPAVREVARRQNDFGRQPRREVVQRRDGLGRLAAPDVQIGYMKNARGHRWRRLYTRIVANEAPELFDDIYLGLRAGGAVRKQRRGEPLSAEEEEAIGHWQRLSLWRRFIAVGAFALGTFGLGFTVGGLIFGRWRAARR